MEEFMERQLLELISEAPLGMRFDANSTKACPSCSLGPRQPSLHHLLSLCLRSHDELLWTEFIHRSQPVIAGVVIKSIRRWTRPNPSLVDDLVQETYLKLCAND